jgi:hypothetical protein
MRADMKKVLCERPRSGGRYSYHDVRSADKQTDYDYLPSHQGMRRPYKDPKEFSDLLGPLQRFMRGCVGRRWDDVWSEICTNVRADSMAGDHLREHARRECETNTCVVDDKVLIKGDHWSFYKLDEPRGLYVDPRDGIIYYNDNSLPKVNPRVFVDGLAYTVGDYGILYPCRLRARKARGSQYLLKVIGQQRAMWINGIWYWMLLKDVPPPVSVPYEHDGKMLHRMVYHPRYDIAIGDYVQEGRYHAEKRQMASRDLRRYGLLNLA